ncbi:hypothetical protein BRPE64_CCDS04110 [Caballeronia insecticola]|uniref:Uncharacterized protein n=1 Tax=Caballeronia insecticola TaxID=758793 RepID=R4WPH8_9BURK|nr:hypothetical protein BRPE64_CCDS04110 [Caballeronia insecticola]
MYTVGIPQKRASSATSTDTSTTSKQGDASQNQSTNIFIRSRKPRTFNGA